MSFVLSTIFLILQGDKYTFQVIAADNGSPFTNNSTATVNIIVFSPDNNYEPVLDQGSYTGSILENTPAGAILITINVTDKDKPGSDNIIGNFSLTGNDAAYFYIEKFGDYGILRTKYVDYKKYYTVQIHVCYHYLSTFNVYCYKLS